MTGERSEHEHQAEIDRLNRVQNEKYIMQHNLHTAQLLNQDLCHREETNQMKAEIYRLKTETNELRTETNELKAEIVIQTNCHKAGMLNHKEEKKWREAKHREEIQMQAASQIEEMNKIKAKCTFCCHRLKTSFRTINPDSGQLDILALICQKTVKSRKVYF